MNEYEQRAKVAEILESLPPSHRARAAFASGAPVWQVVRLARNSPAVLLQLGHVMARRTVPPKE
jgi:hypothetical protein